MFIAAALVVCARLIGPAVAPAATAIGASVVAHAVSPAAAAHTLLANRSHQRHHHASDRRTGATSCAGVIPPQWSEQDSLLCAERLPSKQALLFSTENGYLGTQVRSIDHHCTTPLSLTHSLTHSLACSALRTVSLAPKYARLITASIARARTHTHTSHSHSLAHLLVYSFIHPSAEGGHS
jgi:hypothetical protein